MANRTDEFNSHEEVVDKSEQIQRMLYRIMPFWPLILLALAMGYIGARIYLRYQVSIYAAKARLIVNDQTEQKTANLQEIFKIDTRNLSSETEKEIQILTSKDLLIKVAIDLQLNVIYSQKGRIVTKQFYGSDLPFHLEMETPDSVKKPFVGRAELVNGNAVKFNGQVFQADSLVTSEFGNLRWRINKRHHGVKNSGSFQIAILPISWAVSSLKGLIKIEPISKQSSILDITYSDQVPERAIDVLSSLITVYGKSAVDYKSVIYENSQRFLDKRLSLIADELNGVEKNLQDFRSTAGIIDLGKEGELYLTQVRDADRKIAELEVQMEVLKQISTYVTKRNTTGDPIPATLGITDPLLLGLLNQLYQTETDLQKVKELSGTKNPQIEVYEEVINKLKPGILSSINNLRLNMQASKTKLESENAKMTGSLNKIPSKERLLLDIKRQQEIKNAIYTFLLQKREESAIAAASIVPNYRLIDRPEPWGIVSPQPQKIYTTAVLIAVVLLVVFIYLVEFSSKRVLFRSQIEEFLPIPVISELIFHDHMLDKPVVVGEGKRTLIAEQFRELRTNINYITATSKEKCKIILTTSSIPKEGKSFIAINAAISLSLTGDKVVLLEFDMRKPKISKPLGIERDPGLSNYLVGNKDVSEIIKPHPNLPNLFIIPSGPIPPNPAELMTSEKLTRLFEYLSQHFDFVLIDSPPIAAVTDAKILSPFADATLYIVRHNYTNHVFLNLLYDVYQKKGLKNINIVFNGIKNKKILGYGYSGYGYGYGYGYSYGYGYTVEDKKKKPGLGKLIGKLNIKSLTKKIKR